MLIQATVRTKYLKTLDKQAVQNAYEKFKAHFNNPAIQENIRNSKEEQYQEGFLNDLFVNVLGYIKNPSENYNLTTEYRNVKDSKKADGAIVVNGAVKAIIELKGTNVTDLGQVESQAFGYKNNQPECVYVITSNFEKLRFYIDNAVEHIEFNLFTLSEKDFELLYLCLAFSQIEKGIPKKIKDESISHEDDITKQLYRDYSFFKRELHADLVEKNPEYDTLLLFRKSQKLLSRFLFLFFAEDRQLLPPNSIRLILNQWVQLKELDEYNPLYNRFKKYFGYLNTGYKGKQFDVFAYNGGLFKPDAVLDAVKIDDALLYKHTVKISEYDFASEVDVNILGHIFENSLNELDELKAELSGEIIDKSKTKRKKDGIFYTPKYITKYIVDNTVGLLCKEKKTELGISDEDYTTDRKRSKTAKQLLTKKLTTYREWLLQITICDPACGSGAFLNQALNFLIDEHRYIDELQAKLFGDSLVLSDIENTILENNLFGVDINEESVEIARLSLWLRTAQPNRKLNDLSKNIKCGNSLIDDPAIAGEKAFNWENEFPQVFGREQNVEIVIVPEKDEKPDYLQLIQDKLLASQLKAEQALELSKEAIEISKEAYEYARKLETVSEPHVNYKNRKTGFDVVIGNPPYGAKIEAEIDENSNETYLLFYQRAIELVNKNGTVSFITPDSWLTNNNARFIRKLFRNQGAILSIKDTYKVFADAPDVWCNIPVFVKGKIQGDVIITRDKPYDLPIFQFSLSKERIIECADDEWFIYFNDDFYRIFKKVSNHLFLNNFCQVKRGFSPTPNNLNTTNQKQERQLIGGEDFGRYSYKIKPKYLKDEYKKSKESIEYVLNREFIGIQRIRTNSLEINSRWLICNIFNEKHLIPNDSIGFLIDFNELSSYYVLSILNSNLLNIYYKFQYTDKNVKPIYLSKLPIPNISLADQQPFITKADQMLYLNKELQEISGKFQRNLKREFALDVLSAKLQNWYTLSYAEFIKELEKLKIKLSLHQKAEWESYFQQEVEKAHNLRAQIDTTDREIDQMVYTLYGLTKEEIKIIEQL